MAEDNANFGNTPNSVPNPNSNSGQNENQELPADHHLQQQQPDLGLGQNRHSLPTKRSSQENQGAGASMDPPKREENPFSFKHFLNRDACNGSQNTGAKPKVYTSPSFPDASFSCSDYSQNSSARNLASNPEMASALPDFVQDHLVVEQCYLRDSGPSNIAVAIENLPDFAVNRDCNSPIEAVGSVSPPSDDFKSYLRNGPSRSRNSRVDNVPLDLPNFDLRSPATEGIPFDLPRVDGNSGVGANGGQADVTQPSVSKSLPDFLSDGPIRGGHLNSSQPPDSTTMDFPEHFTEEQRLQAINENLRREIEALRSAYDDQCKRASALYAELRSMRSKESEDSKALEKALSQVEDNLKRCTRRAVSAENTVTRLKQEVKSLSSEVAHLQRENWELRGGEGASGPSTSYASPSSAHQAQMKRYAQELKIAASSAETSLRQLLSGVDNLRVIASSMETLHRIEDRTKDFLPDSDDSSGPAL